MGEILREVESGAPHGGAKPAILCRALPGLG
jgi:hypothetical protein